MVLNESQFLASSIFIQLEVQVDVFIFTYYNDNQLHHFYTLYIYKQKHDGIDLSFCITLNCHWPFNQVFGTYHIPWLVIEPRTFQSRANCPNPYTTMLLFVSVWFKTDLKFNTLFNMLKLFKYGFFKDLESKYLTDLNFHWRDSKGTFCKHVFKPVQNSCC